MAQATPATFDYDMFTIGAGSGGVRSSRMAASYGARVAICELPYATISSDMAGGAGGTCVLRGCVPKKLLVYGSEFRESFHDSVGFGWDKRPDPSFSWQKLMENKNKEIQRLNGVYGKILSNAGCTVMEGRGRVVGPHEVEVTSVDGSVKRYTAKNIVIATGARPNMIELAGAEHAINSDNALDMPSLPRKIVIIGGGFIGCEFACIFNNFGSEVHLVVRQDLILRGFDDECRSFLTDQLKVKGIQIWSETNPVSIEKQSDGTLTVTTDRAVDGKPLVLDGLSHVMFAAGRIPNVKNLGLESVGVKLNSETQAIEVDAYSRSSVPSIWAVGDVTNRVNLTPVALMEGMALAKTLIKNEPTKPDYEYIPSAVFTQPSLSTVGLTEAAAIARYANVDVYTTSFRPMKNTLSGSPIKTFMKLIVEADSQRVVGCHMVGPESAEIMQGLAVAIKIGVTKEQLDSVVGIHPSAAEEFVTMRSVTRQIRDRKVVGK